RPGTKASTSMIARAGKPMSAIRSRISTRPRPDRNRGQPRRSGVQALRPAHEAIVADVEAQRAVGLAGEADPYALSDLRRVLVALRKPQRLLAAEVDAVQAAVDGHRGGEAPRSARQVAQGLDAAVSLHRRYALQRFERPDQDACAYALGLARDIEHPG